MIAAPCTDPVCPACRLTVLTPFTIASYRGQDVCEFCASELRSHDAEDARRNVREMTRYTIAMTPREP